MAKQFKAVTTFSPDFSYEYPGIIRTELLQKPKINTPALSDFARIVSGIRSGEYLTLVNPLTTVLTKGTPDCEPTYATVGSMSDRRLITGLFEVNVQWCKKQFQNIGGAANVLGDSDLIGDGLSGYELGGRLRQVILDEVLEAMRIDVWKVILFGDDSLGAGSTNVFSTIDGVWTHFFDSFGSYCVKPVNNALPKLHNSTLNPGQAKIIMQQLFDGAPLLLKQIPSNQKVIWVTGSMWENLYTSYINDCCVEASWEANQNGISELRYRGIPVIPLWIADQSLEFDTNNPFYDEIRHFAIYTIKENHVIGVENARDLNNLEICYDCRTKTTFVQGEFRMGYNFVHCDLTAIAY